MSVGKRIRCCSWKIAGGISIIVGLGYTPQPKYCMGKPHCPALPQRVDSAKIFIMHGFEISEMLGEICEVLKDLKLGRVPELAVVLIAKAQ